ncbi:MAG TPA: alpha/beta hydrolase [Flavisolibacter sp.]|nr:alpha/beta hydrolase [Flavisolibacter sp.]
MLRKEIKYQGKSIKYSASGEGQPVVLLHGFGEDSWVWKHQVEALSGYHLIVPDLPGSGQSEMIDDMSLEGIAAVIEKILIHETATVFFKEGEPGSVVMIGHSMGGYITLAFTEKYPQMLRAFGLFHSSAFADNEQKKETRRKGIEFIYKNGAYQFLKTVIPNLYSPAERSKQFISAHLEEINNFSGEALVSYYNSMINRPDRTGILKETKLPVLFILGRYDNAVPLEDGLKQCHLPQLSYIHILEKSGHMGMVEESGKSNIIISTFVKNLQKVYL